MKDFIVLVGTTIVIVFVWIGIGTAPVAGQNLAPKDLLEISSPIGATIDTDYLRSLP